MDGIVSRFLVDTCTKHRANVANLCGRLIRCEADDVVLTESTSELYLNPMISFIGDVDLMYD